MKGQVKDRDIKLTYIEKLRLRELKEVKVIKDKARDKDKVKEYNYLIENR
jgi:hypothetical protein